ncbi:hypothetical protein PMZ80_005818 [Knufia obscura]|uniref:Major facilitator superfamily (MFS) profile domain-containing protein n=2 Tax=Knufia TaxID=430999 RepID=A0AAN8I9K9_9EURO|nr:hypothetical protein PMZ80_005818 [Knufia obscura]KAK5954485.1 hypothetical protein OHC33_004207 [Knufia fluminis]
MASVEKIADAITSVISRTPKNSVSTGAGSEARLHDAEHGEEEQRQEQDKKLVRKLDMTLLPVLILMCLFQAVDKSLLSIAKINGIEPDLHLTTHQFNVSIMVFQAGYLTLQLPSNLLITRVRPSIYLSTCCLLWSTVATCHALVHSYSQLLAVRLLLGCCDAPFFVGALHLLSSWYTRSELTKRTSILLGVLVVTLTFMGPMCAGIVGGLEGLNGWRGWRWCYLVFGVGGVVVAGLGWVLLPDYPEGGGRFWLGSGEAEVARRRMREDRVGEKVVERRKLWVGCRDAVGDVRVWIFVLMFMSRKSLEGLYYYEYAIIQSLHLFPSSPVSPQTLTLILGSPPALVAAILAFIGAYTSDRFSERTYHITIPLLIALIGLIISAATLDSAARYVAMYLWLAGSVAGTALAWSWVANSIQETPEKKAVGLAIVNVLSGLGGIWAPFLFRGQDAPGYRLAFGVLSGFVVVDVGCCLVMRWVLGRMNVRLRRGEEERRGGEGEGEREGNGNLYVL